MYRLSKKQPKGTYDYLLQKFENKKGCNAFDSLITWGEIVYMLEDKPYI